MWVITRGFWLDKTEKTSYNRRDCQHTACGLIPNGKASRPLESRIANGETMRCPDCGTEVPEPLSLCPTCGLNIEQTQPMKRQRAKRERETLSEDTIPMPVVPEEKKVSRWGNFWRRLRVVLLGLAAFICLLAAAVVIAGYTGLREGEQERIERRAALADEHYQLGLARLDAGEYELAIAEFEYILRELDPNHGLAQQGLAEANVRLASRPTPTSQAVEDISGNLYQQGLAAYQAADWETAAQALGQLRVFDRQYQAESVEEMLFTSLYNHGMELLDQDRLEEGIFYLDQALQIRPLDEQAIWERELASRYMRALGYWGVDWQECIRQFQELYSMAPSYKDVLNRLYQANVLYGDMWVERGEMCPAAARYSDALQLMNDPQVVQQQAEAAQICAIATPTPIPLITGTLPITQTTVVPGFQAGRLAYPAYNSQNNMYDIYALFADGRLMRVVEGADQPSWQWGADRLIYRDRIRASIASIQPGGQAVTVLADAGAAWPTLSPDGSRYAYAAQDAAGVWTVYIARTDGSFTPTAHAAGWGPAWGPSGLLAWTGCEVDGVTCGIFIDNPDDSTLPIRLTGSENDTALHWAPWGDRLAYMSDHAGSWDIYVLYASGGVEVVTSSPTLDGLPAWASDGSALAFVSFREDRWGVYMAQPDGGNVRQIVDLGPEMPNWQNQRISWAP